MLIQFRHHTSDISAVSAESHCHFFQFQSCFQIDFLLLYESAKLKKEHISVSHFLHISLLHIGYHSEICLLLHLIFRVEDVFLFDGGVGISNEYVLCRCAFVLFFLCHIVFLHRLLSDDSFYHRVHSMAIDDACDADCHRKNLEGYNKIHSEHFANITFFCNYERISPFFFRVKIQNNEIL